MRALVYVATSLSLALAGVACSPARADRADPTATAATPPASDRDTVKIEGCLSGGDQGRLVLTAAPDPVATTVARAGAGDRDTHSYVLVGGDNLQSHIGKRVEVTGTLIGKPQEVEQETKRESQSPSAPGNREQTATVKTTEAVDIEIRQLQVAGVRELAATCQVTR